MPGIFPSRASFRSMMRLMRNLRYTPWARPVSSHRRTIRVLNLGFRRVLAICALVVIASFLLVRRSSFFLYARRAAGSSGLAKGMPICSSTKRLSSGLELLNEKLMFMPWVNVTSAMLISGNTPCSDRPTE